MRVIVFLDLILQYLFFKCILLPLVFNYVVEGSQMSLRERVPLLGTEGVNVLIFIGLFDHAVENEPRVLIGYPLIVGGGNGALLGD